VNEELIKKARQANLAKYLISEGVPLIKSGHRHKHKEHESLVFTDNSYFWNSRQEHGNAVDYLVRHMDMDFVGAVVALTINELKHDKKESPIKAFDFHGIALNSNCDKAKAYLRIKRHIGQGVIDLLVDKRLLFQEKQTNNIIFPMHDENGNLVGAELQGVTAKRFKGIAKDSKYGHGFNVRFSDDNTFDYALFFESAVDLLSFIDYKLNYEKKSLNRCILVSMAGLKKVVVMNYLNLYKGTQAVLCIDNDTAGQTFGHEMDYADIEFYDRSPDEGFKDWNEQLAYVKKHSKPIQRLMKRGAGDDRSPR